MFLEGRYQHHEMPSLLQQNDRPNRQWHLGHDSMRGLLSPALYLEPYIIMSHAPISLRPSTTRGFAAFQPATSQSLQQQTHNTRLWARWGVQGLSPLTYRTG